MGMLKNVYAFSINPKQILIGFIPLAVETAKFKECAVHKALGYLDRTRVWTSLNWLAILLDPSQPWPYK